MTQGLAGRLGSADGALKACLVPPWDASHEAFCQRWLWTHLPRARACSKCAWHHMLQTGGASAHIERRHHECQACWSAGR